MTVRLLTHEDWPAAATLYAQLSTKEPFLMDPDGAAWFAGVLAHIGTSVFGAVHGGNVRAMATLHVLPNVSYGGRPYALIENVVTDQNHRGQGLARAVMQAAIDAAKAANAYKIMLLTGKANNAVGFYERLGFSGDEKAGMILRDL